MTVANELGCSFFDAGLVTSSSEIDGIHLDKNQHHLLGKAIASKVIEVVG